MTTYYLSTTGDNGNDGLSSGNAWATFAYAADNSSAGDTIRVLAGTYDQEIRGNAAGGNLGGSSGNHKTWTADDLDNKPVIKPTGAGSPPYRAINLTATTDRYCTWIGFVFDGTDCDFDACKVDGTVGVAAGTEVVFDRCTFQNSPNNGALVTAGDTANFTDCIFKDNGVGGGGLMHGIYHQSTEGGTISGGHATGNGGYGYHCYNNVDSIIVDSVLAYDNDLDVSTSAGIITWGTNNIIRNCIVYSSSTGNDNVGIWPEGGGAGNVNKVINCTVHGIDNQGSPYGVFVQGTNTEITNVVSYNNTTNYQDSGTGTVTTTNSTDGTDPKFVDAANGDFHLMAASPLIDAGTDSSADGVTVDFDGNPRPDGSAYDIGAYERVGAGAQSNIGPISIIRKLMKVAKL